MLAHSEVVDGYVRELEALGVYVGVSNVFDGGHEFWCDHLPDLESEFASVGEAVSIPESRLRAEFDALVEWHDLSAASDVECAA